MAENSTLDAPDPVAAVASEITAIADALRAAPKILVATHENPDGDAIGSARAAELILQALGADVVVHIPAAAIPTEYAFIVPDVLVDTPPADLSERTLLALDCGNASRLAHPDLPGGAADVLNVDHHGDNPGYGRLNVIVARAACTTQLVLALAHELDVALTPEMATALYVGLVTDTGRFQYSNTTPEAFAMASELVAAGASVHAIFQEIYERVPFARLALLGRGLGAAKRFDDGVVTTLVTQQDFAESGADADDSEGIVDFLRGVDGTRLALFVRELPPGGKRYKGSLRTTQDHVDVSTIARSWGGGGHRQAAGFTTDDDFDTIVAGVRAQLAAQHVADA